MEPTAEKSAVIRSPSTLHEKKDENIIFHLTMEPQTKETLYFHIRSMSSMDLQLYLMSDEDYYTSRDELKRPF
jgi:hypothetical protein